MLSCKQIVKVLSHFRLKGPVMRSPMSNDHMDHFKLLFPSTLWVSPERSLGSPRPTSRLWLLSTLHCWSWLCWSPLLCRLFSDLRTAAGTAGPPAALWLKGLAGHQPCSTEPVSTCPRTLQEPNILSEALRYVGQSILHYYYWNKSQFLIVWNIWKLNFVTAPFYFFYCKQDAEKSYHPSRGSEKVCSETLLHPSWGVSSYRDHLHFQKLSGTKEIWKLLYIFDGLGTKLAKTTWCFSNVLTSTFWMLDVASPVQMQLCYHLWKCLFLETGQKYSQTWCYTGYTASNELNQDEKQRKIILARLQNRSSCPTFNFKSQRLIGQSEHGGRHFHRIVTSDL